MYCKFILLCLLIIVLGISKAKQIVHNEFSFAKWMRVNKISALSVSVLSPSKKLQNYFLGEATPHKPLFMIGSISKTFISAEILRLEAQGKLSINDPLGRFLPKFTKWQYISLRELLNMTSGICRFENTKAYKIFSSNHFFSDEQLINFSYQCPLLFKPGTHWYYSNVNYLLLAKIIEKITHQSIAKVINQHFIQAYHLHDTYFLQGRIPQTIRQRLVTGEYNNQFFKATTVDAVSAGGMISTTADISKWIKLLFTNVLPPQQLAELQSVYFYHNTFEPKHSAYGLGVFSLDVDLHHRVWWYTGVKQGYSMVFLWLPHQQTSIVAAINKTSAQNYFYLFPSKQFFSHFLEKYFQEN